MPQLAGAMQRDQAVCPSPQDVSEAFGGHLCDTERSCLAERGLGEIAVAGGRGLLGIRWGAGLEDQVV